MLIILLIVCISILLLLIILVMYFAFLKAPENPPFSFLSRKSVSEKIIVLAAGDSITQATLSADYVGALKNKLPAAKYEFINAGLNGNTSADLLKRLNKDIIACKPNLILILIGTNDVAHFNEKGHTLEAFSLNLTGIAKKLKKEINALIAFISIPPLGENPNSNMNKQVQNFNRQIQLMATEFNFQYIPFYEKLVSTLPKTSVHSNEEFAFSFTRSLIAVFKRYLFRKSLNEISESNHFVMHTDGVHLNDRSKEILLDLVSQWILNQ